MNTYTWIITFYVCFTLTQSEVCKKEQKCRISRVYRMTGADCHKKDMRNFPQCLPDDVEIIDASYNRIRKLTRNDLKKYTNLKMLYLSDNVILFIEDEAFQEKDDLTTLDLSLNALSKVPPVVFHLPSLNSLYLGQNLNMNIVEVVEEAKPVTSPLIQLDISYIMSEEPSELPEFGILPFLTKYNISGNQLNFVTTKHFAGLCSLKILVNSNVSTEYLNPCDCWTINRWLKLRQVQFQQFVCHISESECSNDVPVQDLQIYEKCNQEREAFNNKNRIKHGLIISAGILAPIILIVLIWYIVFLRRRRQKRPKTNMDKQYTEINMKATY